MIEELALKKVRSLYSPPEEILELLHALPLRQSPLFTDVSAQPIVFTVSGKIILSGSLSLLKQGLQSDMPCIVREPDMRFSDELITRLAWRCLVNEAADFSLIEYVVAFVMRQTSDWRQSRGLDPISYSAVSRWLSIPVSTLKSRCAGVVV